jgi:hypothetical protein
MLIQQIMHNFSSCGFRRKTKGGFPEWLIDGLETSSKSAIELFVRSRNKNETLMMMTNPLECSAKESCLVLNKGMLEK